MSMHRTPRPKPIVTKHTEKPKLEITQLAVFRTHYEDLEQYIHKVYGFDFDFLMATGLTQGMCPEYLVDGKIPNTQAWTRAVADLRRGRRTKQILLILNVLAMDGYIPKGQYTVSTHPTPHLAITYTGILHRTRDPNGTECLQFKAIHGGDKKFIERATTIDRLWFLKMAKDEENKCS